MYTVRALRFPSIAFFVLAILSVTVLTPFAYAAPASPQPFIPDPDADAGGGSGSSAPLPPEPGIIDPWEEEDKLKAEQAAEAEKKKAGSFLGQVGGGITATGGAAGMKSTTPATIVGRLISWFMSILGVILAALMMYGGALWMTAQGSDEKIKKARNILTSATIGLAIVLASWSITSIVIRALTTATAPSSSSEIIDPWEGIPE